MRPRGSWMKRGKHSSQFCLRNMTFTKSSTVLVGIALLLFLGEAISLAASEWFLMSRHGECADIASLKRKIPDLGEVRDPAAFIQLMRVEGCQVTVNEVATSTGKVVEVKVSERKLSLMFVTPEVCHQAGRE